MSKGERAAEFRAWEKKPFKSHLTTANLNELLHLAAKAKSQAKISIPGNATPEQAYRIFFDQLAGFEQYMHIMDRVREIVK